MIIEAKTSKIYHAMRKMFVLLIINNLSLRSIISKTYMKMINRFLLCLIAFGVINIGHSQNNNNLSVSQITGAPNYLNVITTAVPFLTIAPDARAGGMGDAGVATSSPIPPALASGAIVKNGT